jgi:hypothetical protein
MHLESPNIVKPSEQKRIEIKNASAFRLPNQPSARGMKEEEIKKAFWAPILAQNASFFQEHDRIVDEVNGYLDSIFLHVGSGELEKSGDTESDLTAQTKDVWELLKNHVESNSDVFETLARYLKEANAYKARTKESLDNATAKKEAAQKAQTSAHEHAESANQRAIATAGETAHVQTLAEQARQSAENNRALADRTPKDFAKIGRMKKSVSAEFRLSVNSNGAIVFTYNTSNMVALSDENTVYLASVDQTEGEYNTGLLNVLRDNLFSCRLVEITLEEPEDHPFEDPYYYRECTGGTQTVAKSVEEAKDDGNGGEYTRIIQYIERGRGTFGYYLKLSDALANALREYMNAYYSGDTIPLRFVGYN